ncbi:MAG: hypothetical protein IH623_24600 [Verrucomicrobia bacterium]|nr:hypothetical protein [Verrucomicrobiota bacterium]
MSRPFQHLVPSGLTIAVLFYLAEGQLEEVFAFLFSSEVSTFDVVAYHLVAFGLSVGFTVTVPLPAARFVDELAQKWRFWVWVLPLIVPVVLWSCLAGAVFVKSFVLYAFYGLAFLASLVCAGYCIVFWLERLAVYVFQKFTLEPSAWQDR